MGSCAFEGAVHNGYCPSAHTITDSPTNLQILFFTISSFNDIGKIYLLLELTINAIRHILSTYYTSYNIK